MQRVVVSKAEQRAAERAAEKQESRTFLLAQRTLFAGIGVSVQGLENGRIKFQVGDNLVVHEGDVPFARMVRRVLKLGCDVNVRLLELVQDVYDIGAELQAPGTAA